MAVAAFLLVLTACGEKKANQTENGGEATDSLTENVEAEEDEDGFTSDAELAMRKMQTTWSKESIEGLPPEENGLDIVALAVAFCEKYSDFDANKQLVTYFTRRDQFNSDWYFVDEDLKNGYVRCGSGSEISSDVTACYWKKKDGHRLVAFWLELGHEGSEHVDQLLAFYDYDPESDSMTPSRSCRSEWRRRCRSSMPIACDSLTRARTSSSWVTTSATTIRTNAPTISSSGTEMTSTRRR